MIRWSAGRSPLVLTALLLSLFSFPASASGEVDVRRGGSHWARIEKDGDVRIDGRIVGRVEPDGDVRVDGRIAGSVEDDGSIRDDGRITGRVEKDGSLRSDGSARRPPRRGPHPPAPLLAPLRLLRPQLSDRPRR